MIEEPYNNSLDASGIRSFLIDNLRVTPLSPAASTQPLGILSGYRNMRVANAFLLVLISAAAATAQSVDAEMAMLRELLKVPDSTQIVPSASPLPPTSPMHVFVVVGTDPKTQKAFAKRFADWNQTNGSKYGTVEQVRNLSDADVVLVRHDVRLNGPPPSYSLPLVPIRSYSYLIVRGPDKLQILWRTVFEGYSDVTDTESFGGAVRREFFKRMKSRPKR